MKKHLKAILAAALTLTLCAAMSACGNSKSPEDINENDVEQALAGLDKENSSTTSSQSETTPSEEEPEEIVYAPTQEILNADFSSGLIQIGNDVFQQGGYITVAELVEQYSDRYDVTYMNGTYEERKDYLLEYTKEAFKKSSIYAGISSFYGNQLYLTPKNGKKEIRIDVQIANLTSPDEKITLDKAIVLSYAASDVEFGYYSLSYSDYSQVWQIWMPKGFHSYKTEDLAKTNENYTVKSLPEYLTDLGYVESDESYTKFRETVLSGTGVIENFSYSDGNCLYVAGEENLAGYRPIYSYSFSFDKNTDKLSYCNMYIYELIK